MYSNTDYANGHNNNNNHSTYYASKTDVQQAGNGAEVYSVISIMLEFL